MFTDQIIICDLLPISMLELAMFPGLSLTLVFFDKHKAVVSDVVTFTLLLPRASKGLCDRSWCLFISLHFFLEPNFYLPKYSLLEVYSNTDRLLIEFYGLWYSLAAR